jgi:hypothetical protein
VAQNGGLTGSTAEDAEMADAEGDDGMDDDMMDKISSSPSIDDAPKAKGEINQPRPLLKHHILSARLCPTVAVVRTDIQSRSKETFQGLDPVHDSTTAPLLCYLHSFPFPRTSSTDYAGHSRSRPHPASAI